MEQVFDLINEMSPYLLLGFLLAGLMHAFIPNTLYTNYLAGKSFKSVFLAALFGVPLPLCSCGVIPTAMSMRKEGASKGATVSFLIATPQTGLDSIFATYSLLGLPFAIVRPIVAFCTAMFGGQMVNILEKDDTNNISNSNKAKVETTHLTFIQKIVEALRYGFIEMMGDIGKWLVIGLVIAGIITILVPDDFFAIFADNSILSILLVLCISIPMYVCATGSIPIAVALMLKGLTPGAALVLLMAGPAANAASILVINKVMGKKTLLIYLATITIGAIAFGLGIDLLPREWFTENLKMMRSCCMNDTSWFKIGCTIVLCALLLYTFALHFIHKGKHNHCSCESCNEDSCQTKDNAKETNVKYFIIEGMNCSHCSHNAELAIKSVEGVKNASVDLDTKTATVEGDVSDEDIIKAVGEIGFEVSRKE